jgi:hypothetical protein
VTCHIYWGGIVTSATPRKRGEHILYVRGNGNDSSKSRTEIEEGRVSPGADEVMAPLAVWNRRLAATWCSLGRRRGMGGTTGRKRKRRGSATTPTSRRSLSMTQSPVGQQQPVGCGIAESKHGVAAEPLAWPSRGGNPHRRSDVRRNSAAR